MSAPATRAYRLATSAQWRDGVLAGVVRGADGMLQPFAPYARAGLTVGTPGGAVLPALCGDGAAWWRGADGRMRRLAADASVPQMLEAPPVLARTRQRIVAGRHVLWAASRDRIYLHCYALDDLRPILRARLDGGRIVDLADAGKDGVWALAAGAAGARIVHFSCAGAQVRQFPLPAALPRVRAFAALRDSASMALLAADGSALWLWDLAGAPRRLPLSGLEEGALGTRLASDGRRLLFIGVRTRDKGRRLLVADVNGDLLDSFPLEDHGKPTGIDARGARLLVTGARGATFYSSGEAGGASSACELITPMLYSPEGADARGWLRAELSARLPLGATLALDYAGSDDARVRDGALDIARDTRLTPRQRAARLSDLLGGWSEPLVYAGNAGTAAPQQLSAPLFDAGTEHVWLRIRLAAPAGAPMPGLEHVRVLYPDRSLIEHLPAIYRNEAPGGFLRQLVGVLEATTQGLDRRIATLGRLLDPATADGEWLDYTARWLGLPWDDALAIEQKRALMQAAHRILAMRGTRRSLETLLDCLYPHRYRVRDTADTEPLRLGHGAALPGLLGGLPCSAAALGRKAILGRARLPDPQAPGAGLAPPAKVRIDIAASAAERREAGRSLPAMIDALIPVTARAELRWRELPPDGTGTTVGDDMVLGEPADASLGDNAVLGGVRLKQRLIVRLPESGADVGFHLR